QATDTAPGSRGTTHPRTLLGTQPRTAGFRPCVGIDRADLPVRPRSSPAEGRKKPRPLNRKESSRMVPCRRTATCCRLAPFGLSACKSRLDIDLRFECTVNRALHSSLEQLNSLPLVELSGQFNFAINLIEHPFLGLAVGAVSGVDP